MKTKHLLILCLSCYTIGLSAIDNIVTYPGQVLNLTNWKITLPIDLDANASPDEIKQTALNTYSHADYFHLNVSNDGVVFKAHAGGVTTNNSGYPRSELREMKDNGINLASWASNDGLYHVLEVTEKITHVPDVKKHVVVAQIHDASDDIVMLRLETNKLFLEFNGSDGPTLTSNYTLGTTFTFKIVVYNNEMKFYYNGNLFHTEIQTFSGAYFKAGMYTQSSCQGSKIVAGELCTAYGEMELLGLSIFHGASLPADDKQVSSESLQMNISGGNIIIENTPISGIGNISIIDIQGKELVQKDIYLSSSKEIIPLEATLHTGIYVASITQEGKKYSQKILVK